MEEPAGSPDRANGGKMRFSAVLLALVGGVALTGVPAPATAAETSVPLVVGVRGAVGELPPEATETGAQPGAITVDVPRSRAGEVAAELRSDPSVAYVEPDHIARAAAITPADPSYGSQWGIAKTRVNTAWGVTRGASSVTVAVVDTGVKKLPDLAPRILPGYDFVNDDNDPTDDDGHGTMTAGVIAATANNGIGVAGICWYCKILPVKVLGAGGSGSYSDIAAGIRYAADKGSDIINLSLGGSADSQLLRDAVAYAAAKGSLVIAAAGNSGSSALHFPAAIASVLAVGASTPGDARYPWSNYGSSWVDLAAPGCNPAQDVAGVLANFCGTSSATPFASGVAALLASTSPAPSAARIRQALTLSAAKLAGNWVAATSGRVDAAAALGSMAALTVDKAMPAVAFRSPAASATVHGFVTVGVAATDDTGVAKVQLLANGRLLGTDAAAPYAFRWASAGYNGTITLQLRAYDRAGNVTIANRTVWADNTGPAIAVTSATANGAHTRRAVIAVRATDPAGVAGLRLIVNGRVVLGKAGSTYAFAVGVTKTVRVQVQATDSLGNTRLTPARTWLP
ncbi:S8 family serine peptidase [Actinoplanes sp. NPDC051633]|uniref:S8 family serine peptidase n=1 Tax=Actinoplanes sp. NPDC051633 TaxID=3155670 RepID=UPI003441B868